MGIHDRDYYRETSGGFFESWGQWSVTNWIILINAILFVAQIFTQDAAGRRNLGSSPLVEYGAYDSVRILQGEAWRLLTSIFLHADLLHLAFNMLVLWWAGSRVEDLYGRREFIWFYLGSGLFANLVNFGLQAAQMMPPSLAVGASGAVTAALVLYACHDPHQKISLFFVLTVPLWLCAVLYVAMDVFGALGVGQRGIGYVAHLGGALFGFLYYRSGFRFGRLIPTMPSRSRRTVPSLRIVRPDPEDELDDRESIPIGYETPAQAGDPVEEPFERKVDRVLEKVSKLGQESLSPEEREILFRAGEVYKKRRK
jgi:membrane associated rhomboid family serine protease